MITELFREEPMQLEAKLQAFWPSNFQWADLLKSFSIEKCFNLKLSSSNRVQRMFEMHPFENLLQSLLSLAKDTLCEALEHAKKLSRASIIQSPRERRSMRDVCSV